MVPAQEIDSDTPVETSVKVNVNVVPYVPRMFGKEGPVASPLHAAVAATSTSAVSLLRISPTLRLSEFRTSSEPGSRRSSGPVERSTDYAPFYR